MFLPLFRYIGRRISEAESRLLGVKPPDVVTRVPKSFRGRGWKGTVLVYFPIPNIGCTGALVHGV